MSGPLPNIGPLIGRTLSDPREAARQIMALNLSPEVLWQIFAVVVLVTVIVVQTLLLLVGPIPPLEVAPGEFQEITFAPPLIMTLGQGGVLVLTVFLVHWVGRAFGGQGSLHDSLALVTWHQLVMMILPVAGGLLVAILPFTALFVFVGMIGLYFYILTLFVTEIHGFSSPMTVFMGVLLTMGCALFGLMVVFSVIALMAGVGETGNV